MALLDRSKLLQKDDLAIAKVEFKDGDFVYVREMTGRERDRWEASIVQEVKDRKGKVTSYKNSLEDFRAKLAVNTVCDAEGNLLLNPKDVGILSENMSASKLEKIVEKARELNKISDEDQEDLVKNLEDDRNDNSTSDSVSS